MRNPRWKRDELILALDLYFRLDYGQMSSSNKDVIELSVFLNKLPIHGVIVNSETFRNANSVGIKLNNFKAIDPHYQGKGMTSYSKLDEKVFNEFNNNRSELLGLALSIRSAVEDCRALKHICSIEEEIDEDVYVREGKVIYKLHKCRERDVSINNIKKAKYFKDTGKLECEVCGFDFFEKYGELGRGFIECHHRKPLSELDYETITGVEDLILLCSNCHRMIHRLTDVMSVDELKSKILL